MDSLLGETLVGKTGEVKTSVALAGKVVVLYFSASWCPPCRKTTPMLVKARERLLAANKPFEVVFVSSDNDQASFDEYYGHMPWLALPFRERERKAALAKKFKVKGIPTLAVIGEDGATITAEGRGPVLDMDNVTNFPWIPKTVAELLGDTFVKNSPNGGALEKVGVEAIQGKHVILYFSANWCGPCRALTPVLISMYEKAKAKGLDFELVFVSSCQDDKEFEKYFAKMPWLALPYSNREAQSKLSERFQVDGIPFLAVIDSNGNVTNPEARSVLATADAVDNFPWNPPACFNLNEDPSAVNEEVCLVYMSEDKAEIAEYKTVVATIKEQESDLDMTFFFSDDPDGPIVSQLQKLGLPKSDKPSLVMLNLPENGAFYVSPDSAVTADKLRAFVKDFESVERQELERR